MSAPIGFPPPLGSVLPPATVERSAPTPGKTEPVEGGAGVKPFMEHLEHIIEEVDGAQRTAETKATDFAQHRSNDIHGTMISLSQADIQLRFVASIRNKVIEAYREVMRMGA